jgi:hypothetical protein
MNSYRSGSSGYEGEWDLGFRAQVGFENQSGLFGKVTGFHYGGDYDLDSPGFSGEVDFYYVDALIGDTIHCGELCVAIAGGLRYGGFEDVEKRSGQAIVRSYEFDGWGPVIEIAAERALSERLSLYAELSQRILFGEAEPGALQQASSTTDTLAAITEIEAGLQLSFGLGPVQNAFIRVGFEGHYWHINSANTGLWGGVLSIGGTF